jgi:hypothetical protein
MSQWPRTGEALGCAWWHKSEGNVLEQRITRNSKEVVVVEEETPSLMGSGAALANPPLQFDNDCRLSLLGLISLELM